MKFFLVYTINKVNKFVIVLLAGLLILSCASHHPQYGHDAKPFRDTIVDNRKPDHRIYLIGDAGYANEPHSQSLLKVIENKLKKEDENTTLLYLGDNVYPLGMPPDKDNKYRKEAEESLDSQMALAKSFKGKTYFIPGNHDWYFGLKGLQEQDDYITDKLDDKKAFIPGKGCGIDDIELNDSITLIAVDSQWFIEDWDRYPTMNDDCDIKTREAMLVELEDEINDNQNKLIVLAIHHPMMTNGTHGGEFSAKKQLFPLKYKVPIPILGSLVNLARKASGYSTQDIQSRVYNDLKDRIKTLIQGRDNIIVVSGHDHNIQYINHDNIHQIISGAGSKVEAARAIYPNDFSYGGTGYVILDFYKDGKAKASYFALEGNGEKKLFERTIDLKPDVEIKDYPDTFPPTATASIYTPEMTDKGGTYNFLFGKHYRKYYSKQLTVPTVSIDTLYGGLKPVKAGGGHQSKSLRLADKDGKEYVMRGLKKSASRFLQTVALKKTYVGDDLKDTYAESFLLDFYTTAHPYTPFILGELAESVDIYHTNPVLYYVPKQDALGKYNENYGDELYMIEEHPGKEHHEQPSFGKPDDIESTSDVYENLRKDQKYVVDERAYIRARLFDMLIGDWDRHEDQWKWAVFEKNDTVTYKPIPRDRDQAFSTYDGTLLSVIMKIPALRHMQSYKDDIDNVKWMNREAYPMDLALTASSGKEVWLEETEYLQKHLTDEAIEAAFAKLPPEVNDGTIEEIKANLKARRGKLEKYAMTYYKVLLETVIITGTDDKEKFVITRMPGGATEVKMYSLKKDELTLASTRVYNRSETKEIWIYGLDDNDEFVVKGKPDKPILVRLLGGQNHDTYTVENGRKVRIYDFKSKKNTYNTDHKTKVILTDDYETNSYDVKKPHYDFAAIYPNAGYNPDDGVKLGASLSYTVNNFNRKPYSQKHIINGNYFFATSGFEFIYRGEFMNVANKWNIGMDAKYTSPNYSINFFGYGNESENPDDELGLDYNRVKLQQFRVAPSFFKTSRNGSFMQFQYVFETIEVEDTANRFVNEPGFLPERLFEHRQYLGVNAKYSFANYDTPVLPTLGMGFHLALGWTMSVDKVKQNFPHLEAFIDFIHNITHDKNLVFETRVKGDIRFNDNYEFYQGAILGGEKNLRGYRRERFIGKQAAYHSSDLRLKLGKFRKSFVPASYGIYAGYDYGRVWIEDEDSDKLHQSVGGGIWINGLDALTARVFYFVGSEGGRAAFTLKFGF